VKAARRQVGAGELRIVFATLAALYLPIRVPFEIGHVGLDPIYVYYFDFPALALIAMEIVESIRRPLELPRALAWMTYAIGLLMFISFGLNPSVGGALFILRAIEAVAIVRTVLRMDRTGKMVVAGVICLGVVWESLLAIAQVANGESFGFTRLGEGPLTVPRGPFVSAQGTFTHPYILVGFTMLGVALAIFGAASTRGKARIACIAFMVVAAIPVALTFSRMALVSVVFLLLALLASRRRWAWIVAGALVVSIVVPSLIVRDGWVQKIETTSLPSFVEGQRYPSTRIIFIRQSLALIGIAPVVGVGPSRYLAALQEHHENGAITTEVVHNVPLLLTTETGIPAGLLALAMLAFLGVLSFEGGLAAICIYLVMVPFVLLDHFLYDYPQGVLLTGFWIAAVLSARSPDLRDAPEKSVDETA
jgi:hypothetical protein